VNQCVGFRALAYPPTVVTRPQGCEVPVGQCEFWEGGPSVLVFWLVRLVGIPVS
jgi:hypothetical protein